MKGFLFDQNLPARLTFKPSLPVTASISVGSNPTDTGLWGAEGVGAGGLRCRRRGIT